MAVACVTCAMLQPLAQHAMLRLGRPDHAHVFLICAVACLGMALVLAWML